MRELRRGRLIGLISKMFLEIKEKVGWVRWNMSVYFCEGGGGAGILCLQHPYKKIGYVLV